MSSWLVLAAAIAAAVGVELNVRQDRRCFWLWLFSNGVQVWFALWILAETRHAGALCNAALFAYYWIQAARGLLRWKPAPGGKEV